MGGEPYCVEFGAVAITSKILRKRGEKQAKELGIDPHRVPPGQYLTQRFPVLTYGRNPKYDLDNWSLSIDGQVEQPYAITWAELNALPQHEITVDIHCVTRWSKLDTTWVGVKASDLLDRAKPTGTHVMAHSDGGYTTNIPLDALYDDDVLVAHTFDGKPLEHDHGAPLRLLVPKRYFWKSAKFLRRLEVMPKDKEGFWELNGYHNDADPWKEQRHWF
jgi:DMSO/TMAO reductase YedYZ molybdopterin-dependent catalytic subunit